MSDSLAVHLYVLKFWTNVMCFNSCRLMQRLGNLVWTSGKRLPSVLNLITCTKSNLAVKVNMDESVGELIKLNSYWQINFLFLLLSQFVWFQNVITLWCIYVGTPTVHSCFSCKLFLECLKGALIPKRSVKWM